MSLNLLVLAYERLFRTPSCPLELLSRSGFPRARRLQCQVSMRERERFLQAFLSRQEAGASLRRRFEERRPASWDSPSSRLRLRKLFDLFDVDLEFSGLVTAAHV